MMIIGPVLAYGEEAKERIVNNLIMLAKNSMKMYEGYTPENDFDWDLVKEVVMIASDALAPGMCILIYQGNIFDLPFPIELMDISMELGKVE